ncbi:ABC transporter ATP-binding protein [Natrononativus amylolyticus]|uniref:ABC transporter ATP-binding protein n=1 Tax=Natrononativus amylolyticus TaxID=2963434 RepID=UPI0020CF890C|nr:ABC transporter ATP-binding protein [Natrononativus amylolyticus]
MEREPRNTAVERTIRCSDVSHEFGSAHGAGRFRRRVRPPEPSATPVDALRGVSFETRPSDVVGLAGPSGSGKSTLLHVVGGLLVPTSGTVELCGTDLTAASGRERARIRRETVGFVFQRFHLLRSLSARANVAVPLVQLGVPKRERRRRADALLEAVGLADRRTHLPGALSGGEQQRVAIARALATDPAVVLADEPTGELDTETGRRVLEVLTAAAGERTVVIASHDEYALAVADRVVELRDGRVIHGDG